MAGSSTDELVRWQYSATSDDDAQHSSPNVWKMMNYVPPRGPCGYKQSIVSAACTCLRFMVHPIKAPTSFECDGCGHHASFHSMHMRVADEFALRWTKEDGSFDREAYEADEEVQEVLERRRKNGTSGELSSIGGMTMPGKARATLLSQPSAKKRRTEKQ